MPFPHSCTAFQKRSALLPHQPGGCNHLGARGAAAQQPRCLHHLGQHCRDVAARQLSEEHVQLGGAQQRRVVVAGDVQAGKAAQGLGKGSRRQAVALRFGGELTRG